MKDCKRGIAVLLLLMLATTYVMAQRIKGKVADAKTKEALIGAMVTVKGSDKRAVTDMDGNFMLDGLRAGGSYDLVVSYVGYKTQTMQHVKSVNDTETSPLVIDLEADEHTLGEVSIVGIERKNTEVAAVQQVKNSNFIVSNVSAQEIEKTQDSNAGEVIRRVPGVSLIDDKFVMVRGLSQRYNNVWMNGGAVPSSEADSRAFSFDIIPSQQIDNLTIVKTPSAEYPADYTGGFILINTKEIPTSNSLSFTVGGNWNDASLGDFTTFTKSTSSLSSVGSTLTDGGFNNDWMLKNKTVVGDLKLGVNGGYRWNVGRNRMGLIAALNFSNDYRTYDDMQNNLFGVYDVTNDHSNYLRNSVDDQYNNNRRLGAMLNFTLLSPSGNHKYELKNIFNRLTNQRYTWREGVSAQSNLENSAEYYYRSRTAYNTQLTGKHTFNQDVLDWSVGYAYSNRYMPDRRRYLVNDALESGKISLSAGNDISREWTELDEHIVSANVNNKKDFRFNNWTPTLKVGAYGEYRTRDYMTRDFVYNWDTTDALPDGFRTMDIPTLLSDPDNLGDDKLYLIEQVRWRNNYSGNNTLGAGYFTASLPFGPLSILAGVRFEHNDMELISNTRNSERSESSRHYKDNDFFPSFNATYKFNDKHQLRASYGRTINRPEFRELSSSVYYDFDLASNVQGNTELKSARIDNIDLRYEFYPSRGEQISFAAFYKHFDSPIEWTYTVAGGTDLIYSYKNAQSANNYGLELDIRKDLSFIGLRNFSWSFNGALIHSRVNFPAGSKEENRPMQGQSPYLVNTGIFYRNDALQLNVALLYNRIGKRIIGVGRSEGSSGSEETARIPDSYEMPRDVMDLTASKKFGEHWELKFNMRDILAQKLFYKQFADVHLPDGTHKTVDEIVRSYKPGRNIGLSLVYKL
ncbi:MAG: TonB-dependent receptor [Prevotella sp.]|nr:TonB-dependent receptor [Prevotella sp.]